jgi:ubiquinone/menaquinone biosynthesis C-methylase UbiE
MVKKTPKKIEQLDLAKLSVAECLKLPYAAGTVKEIACIHKLEYVPAKQRIAFMEEMWRVLEAGGKINMIVCYWASPRAIQDPSAEWPPLCEQSFLYFNKGWREQNNLPPVRCDFDFTYGYQVDPETAARNTESQSFWIKHYINAVTDLQLVLVKRT